MTAQPPKTISIVFPVHNEEQCLETLYGELIKTISTLPYAFELIFVNDGSVDRSLEILRALRAKDPRVKYISFSKNYGHQIALSAGMLAASGHAVIHMDADLQHPPAMLPELIRCWEEGNDIVDTQKLSTEEYSASKALLTRAFYRFFNSISDIKLDTLASDFRLLDRKCVDAINRHGDRERFLRGMTQSIGFKRKVIQFTPAKRAGGQSSYTFRRMCRLALSGISVSPHCR